LGVLYGQQGGVVLFLSGIVLSGIGNKQKHYTRHGEFCAYLFKLRINAGFFSVRTVD